MLVRSTFNKNVCIIILKLARVSLDKVTVGCRNFYYNDGIQACCFNKDHSQLCKDQLTLMTK